MDFGVQTFTIRKKQKKNLEAAYLPLAQMGVRQLEIARIHFNAKTGKAVQAVAQKHGLQVAAIQVKPWHVADEMEAVLDFCCCTGCRRVVISQLPFSCIFGSEQKFYDFVDTLDALSDRYEAHGIQLAYHHHNWEYITLSSGKTRMEELLEKTQRIHFVHDTYWTTKCGLSSPQQIRQFGSRLLGIHLRDLTLYQKGMQVLSGDAAIGTGIVDFRQVLQAAEETGCQYLVIEQKTKRPYADLRISLENCRRIRQMLEEER